MGCTVALELSIGFIKAINITSAEKKEALLRRDEHETLSTRSTLYLDRYFCTAQTEHHPNDEKQKIKLAKKGPLLASFLCAGRLHTQYFRTRQKP